ncbi:hypothetical protein DINM_001110 [Dirofilaria immitis]|nr:hypothetical protein [Dirofilaria immitis]
MGKVWTSPVFNLSVSAMYQLCGEPVAVDLVNNKTVCGNIFTFDPTSYSVVIIIFACNADLECWLGKLLRGAPQSSKEQVSERRKRLIEWLEQNQIRVTSNSDGSITLFDAVRIVAPFTAENCLFLSRTHDYEDFDNNQITAVIETEQDSGGSPENQGLIKELSAENRNFKEKFLDGNQASIVSEEHENNKSDNNGIMEDALERTINEVAETSLQSAAVEGEDLTNENSSKYDWDAPIVKDIVRRVKNHRLSHAKAAEQLSLLMDAKVTSIGVRLQVVKMANDEALAKQDQRSGCIKTFKSGNSSPDKVASKIADTSMRERENKSPVSYRTRSKTGVKQNTHSLQSSKSDNNMEVHGAPINICEGSSQCAGNTNNGISLPMTTVQNDTTNNQLYLPVIISQPASGAAVGTKMVPPVIRLLDNEGKLTHIAVAENGSYKLYRVSEGGTNAEQMQMVNQAVSTNTSPCMC